MCVRVCVFLFMTRTFSLFSIGAKAAEGKTSGFNVYIRFISSVQRRDFLAHFYGCRGLLGLLCEL